MFSWLGALCCDELDYDGIRTNAVPPLVCAESSLWLVWAQHCFNGSETLGSLLWQPSEVRFLCFPPCLRPIRTDSRIQPPTRSFLVVVREVIFCQECYLVAAASLCFYTSQK
ncbi:hypothetical protein PIB30_083474 [Stylosanthes scabra]|uniref:Uncharacterized protein n=1 Tax=Stylosanthes scabra TaxID=79078 RepID=A0ABU6YV26_9FABA|nr:hypothetical protein [Stylosanthes scabra]